MQAFHVITRALRLIGAIASNEVPKAAEARDGFVALNDMVDAFTLEPLTMYEEGIQRFPLTAGLASYTIGPAGIGGTLPDPAGGTSQLPYAPNWVATARPVWIRNMTVIPVGTDQAELPLEMLDIDQWAAIPLKTTPSTFPTQVRYEPTMPYGSLTFWPVPSEAATVSLYIPQILKQFRDLTTEYVFPPGYARMLVFNLATELAPEYGRPVPPEILEMASEYKGNVKRANIPTQEGVMRVDEALLGRSDLFNYRTGDPR